MKKTTTTRTTRKRIGPEPRVLFDRSFGICEIDIVDEYRVVSYAPWQPELQLAPFPFFQKKSCSEKKTRDFFSKTSKMDLGEQLIDTCIGYNAYVHHLCDDFLVFHVRGCLAKSHLQPLYKDGVPTWVMDCFRPTQCYALHTLDPKLYTGKYIAFAMQLGDMAVVFDDVKPLDPYSQYITMIQPHEIQQVFHQRNMKLTRIAHRGTSYADFNPVALWPLLACIGTTPTPTPTPTPPMTPADTPNTTIRTAAIPTIPIPHSPVYRNGVIKQEVNMFR